MSTADQEDKPMKRTFEPRGNAVMLLHEDLARARMRESQRMAAQLRLARRLATADRWRRLADWAARHASKAAAAL